ncbi:LysR substrate-binding domain-containing protein [Serratia fonticola]|uniref:LysR substrate-binding domain-containing protein n=1 Tax=Serratia fonticola TaxID=47917 RepID=UPI0021BDCCC2|nr:LysR substrate-binding domain-containing protein [Serratia fonticola]
MYVTRVCLNGVGKTIVAARAARVIVAGKFVVGYTTVCDRSVIPDVFEPLRQRFPNWQIVTQGKHSISLLRDIKNGIMDVAFIGLHTEAKGLKVEMLFEDPLIVALPAIHLFITTEGQAAGRCLSTTKSRG